MILIGVLLIHSRISDSCKKASENSNKVCEA